MADTNVILLFNSQFGSRGSGNDNFDYPSGICIANNQIYIADKQNHRIKIHDLNGAFISTFGSFGTGNDNFSFPEFIISDGTNLYISDSANHRIKVHDLNGVYVSQFGTRGSGNSNFDYPMSIALFGENLLIADKQNGRVKVHTKAGTFVDEITGLNFPEGVTVIDDLIVVANSADSEIKFYNNLCSFLFDSNQTFIYPTSVREINGVLAVTEKQNSEIIFLNSRGELILEFGQEGQGRDEFYFPYDSVFDNDFYFVVDSANHKIQKYDITIEADVPIYADEFLELTKQLYPTGRAWWMKKGGIFEKIHHALAYSESRINSTIKGLLNSILPDNPEFSEQDANNWEKALALITPVDVDLEIRKEAITRKMQFPGSVPARQHYLFIEGELQKAGFDVYVHENRFGDPPSVVNLSPSLYGSFSYGQLNYGEQGVINTTAIANHIEEEKDEFYNFGTDINLRATFFIGGENYGNRAVVDPARKNEFRELILKMKPAQTAGMLFVDYGEPPDTSIITTDQTELSEVSLTLTFSGAAPSVDWGDGSPSEFFVSGVALTKNYDFEDIYKISINGNLSNITNFVTNVNKAIILNLSEFSGLILIDAFTNLLTELDLSANTLIEDVDIHNNDLTSIDLTNNTALKYFNCYNNEIASLDFTNNTSLLSITCRSMLVLASINLTGLTVLDDLFCYLNNLSTLDVSTNVLLDTLWCYNNNLSTLNLTNNTVLRILQCQNNSLTTLDISNNTILRVVQCQGNGMTSTSVDNIYINLAANGVLNGTLVITAGNSARTAASDAARTTLLANGWTIT
jgi:hypothetical protein